MDINNSKRHWWRVLCALGIYTLLSIAILLVLHMVFFIASGQPAPKAVVWIIPPWLTFGMAISLEQWPPGWRDLAQAVKRSPIWPYVLWRRYLAAIGAPTNIVWNVYVNDVLVGRLPDIDYARIRVAVLSDPKMIVAQILNVLKVPLRFMNSLLVALPLFTFWFTVAAAIFAPEAIVEAMADISAAIAKDPSGIKQLAEFVLNIFIWVGIITIVIMFACGHRYGFRNLFERDINLKILRLCGVAAQGDILLVHSVSDDAKAIVAGDLIRP